VKRLAIVGSTIVPMDEPRTLTGHTVVVVDGRITAVAPSDAIDTSGMDVLDATGLRSTLLTEADDATALVENWSERGYEQVKGYSLLAPGPDSEHTDILACVCTSGTWPDGHQHQQRLYLMC
jgi:hypothetical protein